MVLAVTRPETAQKEEGVLRAAGGAVHVTSTSPRTVFFPTGTIPQLCPISWVRGPGLRDIKSCDIQLARGVYLQKQILIEIRSRKLLLPPLERRNQKVRGVVVWSRQPC